MTAPGDLVPAAAIAARRRELHATPPARPTEAARVSRAIFIVLVTPSKMVGSTK